MKKTLTKKEEEVRAALIAAIKAAEADLADPTLRKFKRQHALSCEPCRLADDRHEKAVKLARERLNGVVLELSSAPAGDAMDPALIRILSDQSNARYMPAVREASAKQKRELLACEMLSIAQPDHLNPKDVADAEKQQKLRQKQEQIDEQNKNDADRELAKKQEEEWLKARGWTVRRGRARSDEDHQRRLADAEKARLRDEANAPAREKLAKEMLSIAEPDRE